jgi:sulfite exporter TauE/SafE
MTSAALLYGTALLLGSVHALEPDHVATVTTFAVRRPGARGAISYGIHWAAGHGIAIVAAGATLVLIGARIPETADRLAECMIGFLLIGLGLWSLLRARRAETATAHDCAAARESTRRRASTAIGLVHGLAGTGPVVALLPLAIAASPGHAIAYLAVFALGTIGAMAVYTLTAGHVLRRIMRTPVGRARTATLTGLGTIAVGLAWIVP